MRWTRLFGKKPAKTRIQKAKESRSAKNPEGQRIQKAKESRRPKVRTLRLTAL
jgi:hypothetical protein